MTQEVWPQQFVNQQVRDLIDRVDLMKRQIETLSELIADLNLKKADRRGRKPKNLPMSVHRGKSVETTTR